MDSCCWGLLQSWARGYTAATPWTTFSGPTMVYYCILSIFVVATPLRHRNLNVFEFFLVTKAELRCREVKKIVTCPALQCFTFSLDWALAELGSGVMAAGKQRPNRAVLSRYLTTTTTKQQWTDIARIGKPPLFCRLRLRVTPLRWRQLRLLRRQKPKEN